MIGRTFVPIADCHCLESQTTNWVHSKPSEAFSPSQQHSQTMVQTSHVSTIADLEYQPLHQFSQDKVTYQ